MFVNRGYVIVVFLFRNSEKKIVGLVFKYLFLNYLKFIDVGKRVLVCLFNNMLQIYIQGNDLELILMFFLGKGIIGVFQKLLSRVVVNILDILIVRDIYCVYYSLGIS